MKKNKEFKNILDDCLERLLIKGETIEQCLQSYPEHAAEIKPLLQTAMATKQALAIQPSVEFRAKARYQLHSALQDLKPKKAFFLWGWAPRWATTAIAIVLALLLAGGGTVAAAAYSMPDSPLYPVKLATEQAQLTMTPTNLGKAKLSAKLADRRVAEIVYVLNKGESEQIEPTTQHLSKHLIMIASLPLAESGTKRAPTLEAPVPSQQPAKAPVPPPPEAFAPPEPAVEGGQFGEGVPVPVDARARLKLLLQRYAVNHPAVLRMVLERAPESAKPALRRAIAESIASYSKAIEALD